MTKIVLPIILIASSSLICDEIHKDIKQEAKSAIMKMGKTLKTNMKQNMKAGGAVQAAGFCLEKATQIEKKVNSSYPTGMSVKRVSLKYRNPVNKPSEDEAKVLKNIESDFEAKKEIPKKIVKVVSKNSYKVYKPIFINKGVCLLCHGDEKARDKEAYKLIKQKYPKDRAIGYKKGDFRGAFVVEIVKNNSK